MNTNNNNMNPSIQSQAEVCRMSPPSSRPVASISSMPNHKMAPGGSSSCTASSAVPSLRRQLKRLSDSNTVKEAQIAIQALVPIIHRWIQSNLKKYSQDLSIDNDNNNNFSSHHDHNQNTPHDIIRALCTSESNKTSSSKSASDEFLHDLHGVSILVLALKEWETCPVVVGTTLRILAFLVGKYPRIGQGLVDMGGLRIVARSISNHHSAKNEQVVTSCVALLSELAQHLPLTVASDACLALVVHGLWKFPTNGILQGFGCLFLERVLVSTLLQQQGEAASDKSLKKEDDDDDKSEDTTNDTWNVTTIDQQDTLQKVVVPLLLRMGKFHNGSNPSLCHRAQQLFQLINQRLTKVEMC